MNRSRFSLSPLLYNNVILTLCFFLAANIASAQRAPKKSAGPNGIGGPIITATQDDGVPAATRKMVGETVTYTIQINSTGSNDATGVTLTDPTAANTSEVAGSLNVTSVARDDTYPQTVQANQTVNTATSGFTVVTNDYPGILAGNPVALSALTITQSGTSSNGGIVAMTTSGANVGRFVYSAPPGFTGTDTFTYTISNGVAGTPAGSATGTVSITVSGPVIWFVDDSAPAGGNGTWTGTNSKAFQTVAQAAAVDAANHRIFVLNNSGSSINYANGVALNTTEWLIGQGATNSPTNTFDALMGISPGTDTPARPSIAGVRPTLQSTVTLEANARVQGLNLATTTSTGMNDPAGAITGVNVSEVSVTTTTGTAVSLSSADGTLSFTSISANGGTNGIVLNTVCNTTGSFTVTGVSTTAGSGGTIQNTTSDGVRVTTSMNLTLTNMNLTNDAQTQVVPGSSTQCGGALTSGSNLSCVAGIYLQNVTGVTLTRVSVTGSNQMGINGNNVTTFTMSNSTITGNGDEDFEDGLAFQNLKGTCSITDTMIKDNAAYQIALSNFDPSSTLTLGITGTRTNNVYPTMDTSTTEIGKTTQTNTFTNQALLVDLPVSGTSVTVTLNLTGVVFNNSLPGNSVLINPVSASGTFGGTTTNCSFDNTAGGVIIQAQNGMNGSYDVTNSEFNRVNLQSILYAGANPYNGAFTGTASGNHIGEDSNGTTAGQACEPNATSNCHGIDVNYIGGTGSISTRIANNFIQQFGGTGIKVTANGTGGADVNVNIVGNKIYNPTGLIAHGIETSIGTTASANIDGCLGIGGAGALKNDISGTYDGTCGCGSTFAIVTNVRFLSHHRLPGYGGSSTAVGGSGNAVTDYIVGNNTVGASQVFTQRGNSGDYPGGAACATPLLFAEGGVAASITKLDDQLLTRALLDSMVAPDIESLEARGLTSEQITQAPLDEFGAQPQAAPVMRSLPQATASLTQPELDVIVSAALERWGATGLNDNQLAMLRRLKFQVTDLPDLRLGEANGKHISVDNNAGGNGWFIGADDTAFIGDDTRRYTTPSSVPAGRIDLLTAIMHEMGHALGLDDSYLEQDRDSLMYGYLTKGERRLPAKDQARGAMPHTGGDMHFLTAPVVIGTLPPNKSVKIQYSVTIGPIAGNPQQISSQGTVSGSNFSNVLTDDPTVGGATDPTVTLLGIPPTFTSADNTTFTVGTNGNFSVTANGAPSPTFTTSGLPTGVSLDANGLLHGTPAAGTGGVYNITITAANTIAPNAMQSFTLTVNEAPSITSANSTTFTVGTAGTFTVTKTGFPTPTLSKTGAIPSGVMFDNSSGVLSGTPAAGTGGSYPITFTASNGIGSDAMQSFTLTVNQPPAITSADNATFTVGTFGTFSATATGFPVPTFSETGALPGGVTLSSAGVLSGTPNADTDGSYPFTLKASNGVGTDATQAFTLTVNAVPCTPPPANMISWWPGDGNASDLVGGHDGTLAGGANANATGEVNKAFQFQGTTQEVDVPNDTVYDFGANPFTIDTWVKFNSVSGSDVFVGHSEGTGFLNKWIFWLKSGNLAIHLNGPAVGGAVDIGIPFFPTTGQWYHVAVTRSGSIYKFYVNGAQIGTDQTNAAVVPPANAQLTLGKAEAILSLNGFLDEVEIFNRTLTGPELAGIYYAGRFGKCAPPLSLVSAVSRKTHAAAGTFDVNLPLAGAPGIECRATGGNHTLVFTFTNGVVSGNASVTSGAGSVSGSPTFAGKTMTVNLTGVTNAQQITVKVSSVTDAVAQVLPDQSVNMNVLAGDTTANKAVNSSDIAQTKAQSGAPVNGVVGAANFRNDVTVNGSINSTDISLVKAQTGTGVP